ncbi:hypothetical protein F5X97DRAFT_93903 [Nemania serpens]|nr:hypothetical protein F5X97DRAFT_93903 [Nemania serpens]
MAHKSSHGSRSHQKKGSDHSSHCPTTSYAPSSRPANEGCSSPRQADEAKWRWTCGNCKFSNLSYIYDLSCPGCMHPRDACCHVWAVE